MKASKHKIRFVLFFAALAWSLSGCAGIKERLFPSEPEAPPAYVHTVQWPEESLSKIAEWYTGDSTNTAAIMTANPSLTIGVLPIGKTIFIPGELVKTREPMPRDFLDKGPYEEKEPYPAPPTPEPPAYFVHTVTYSGESLSIIAAWYTGNLMNWKKLAEANTHLDPNRINLGDRINIPENLLVTRERMPLSHVEKYVQPPPKPKPPTPLPQPKEEVIIEKPKEEKIEEPPAEKEVEKELPIFGPK